MANSPQHSPPSTAAGAIVGSRSAADLTTDIDSDCGSSIFEDQAGGEVTEGEVLPRTIHGEVGVNENPLSADTFHHESSPSNIENNPLEGLHKSSPTLAQKFSKTRPSEFNPLAISPKTNESYTQPSSPTRLPVSPTRPEPTSSLYPPKFSPNRNLSMMDEQLSSSKVLKKPKGLPASPHPKTRKTDVDRSPRKDSQNAKNSVAVEELLDGSLLCAEIDNFLRCMHNLNKQMLTFHVYIVEEDSAQKPLYQWSTYHGYDELRRFTTKLDDATDKLKALHDKRQEVRYMGNSLLFIINDENRQTLLPRKYVSTYLERALKFSFSTSEGTAIALQAMNTKTVTCMEEVEASLLDDNAKDDAKNLITAGLQELLSCSTAGTNSMYYAMDLLQKVLFSAMHEDIDKNKHTKGGSWKSWTTVGLSILSLGLAGFSLYTQSPGSELLSGYLPNCVSPQVYPVVDITALKGSLEDTIQAVADVNKLDNLVISARLNYLDEIYADTGYRIDNIWDALGAPNQNGTFEFGSHTCKLNKDLASGIDKIRQEVKSQLDNVQDKISKLETVHKDIVQLRKHIHRVDIRLTKRIDHVRV